MGSYVLLTYLLTQSEDTEVQATGFDGKKTLMIQKVLSQPHWQRRFTPRDYTALTPLIWEYVNPYGRLDLDMMRVRDAGYADARSRRHDRRSEKQGYPVRH